MTKFSKIFLFMLGVLFCQQAGATTQHQVVSNANERFKDLSEIIQSKGPETIINSINSGQEKSYQNHPIMPLVLGDATNGGHIIWVEEGKVVVASANSAEIGKDVSADPLVKQIIEVLRKSPDEKVNFTVDGGKKTVVAWGRQALLNEKLDKGKHTRFFCYVLIDNPGT